MPIDAPNAGQSQDNFMHSLINSNKVQTIRSYPAPKQYRNWKIDGVAIGVTAGYYPFGDKEENLVMLGLYVIFYVGRLYVRRFIHIFRPANQVCIEEGAPEFSSRYDEQITYMRLYITILTIVLE